MSQSEGEKNIKEGIESNCRWENPMREGSQKEKTPARKQLGWSETDTRFLVFCVIRK